MKSKKVSKKSLIKEEKKKNTRWLPIIALGIIIIMVASSLALIKGENNDSYDFNGFSVTKTEQGWSVSKGQGSLLFLYDPRSLQNITINMNLGTTNKVYIVSSENTINELVILKTYLNRLGLLANDACFNEENCPDVPIVDCNSTTPVLYFQEGENSISQNNNCIIFTSNQEDRLKVIDAFIYKLIGAL